ncbi:hypothetical protein G6F60_014874 [Rhizopus arrhizus]|nr:hypothetical protein G6F23_013152 [Rhizopus arrhizus]KAG1385367.1 hypothetical protein G6F60_014874 [Rhizopus arrhizus]
MTWGSRARAMRSMRSSNATFSGALNVATGSMSAYRLRPISASTCAATLTLPAPRRAMPRTACADDSKASADSESE